MRKQSVLMIVIGFLLHASAGWAQQPPPATPAVPDDTPAETLEWMNGSTTPASQVASFEARCTACHDNPAPESRAPSRERLRMLTPERVLAAVTTGPMVMHARGLSDEQKRAMAELVAGKPFGGEAARAARSASAMQNRCAAALVLDEPWKRPRWNGSSPDPGTGWRFQAAPSAGLAADRVPNLKLKWAFAMPGAASAAWAPPSVVGAKLFVGSDNGFVYALDARSGCVHWSFEAQGQVRSAVVIADVKGVPGVRYGAFFGDYRGNVYGLDAETGKQLWVRRVDEHEGAKITGTPVVDPSGRLIVPVTSWEEIPGMSLIYKCCTFQGSVVALDASSGRQIWKTYTLPERPHPIRKNSAGTELVGPAGSGVWNAPTLDIKRNVVYVGTGNSYIVTPNADTDDAIMAFDLQTGRRLWWTHMGGFDPHTGGCGMTDEEKRINCPGLVIGRDDDASGAPVLYTALDGRRLVIEGQESGRVTAVDPDKRGEVVWVVQAGHQLAASNNGFGGAFDGELYFKPLPFEDQTGAMAALKAATGERVWYTRIPKPTNCPDPNARQTCHSGNWAGASAIPGAVFTGSRDGVLRAFSAREGRIIWEYATGRPYDTVNGVPGNGGGIGGPGPTIVDGMLYTGSGYAILGGAPGNVLLAFGLD